MLQPLRLAKKGAWMAANRRFGVVQQGWRFVSVSPETNPAEAALRVQTLAALDILDTPPEESFDRITRLASGALGVPVGPFPAGSPSGDMAACRSRW